MNEGFAPMIMHAVSFAAKCGSQEINLQILGSMKAPKI
jgi:hypothetical protein